MIDSIRDTVDLTNTKCLDKPSGMNMPARDGDRARRDEPYPGAPGWVKVFAVVVLVAVLVLLIVFVLGALGLHSPMGGHGG
jgi:hypothetical protein